MDDPKKGEENDNVEDELGSLADIVDVDALSDSPPPVVPVDILEEEVETILED